MEVNGQTCQLVSANYNLPRTVGQVQIDCPITKGCSENGTPSFWGLDKAARLRLWPVSSPLLQPESFVYPVKQKWFATDTQMANEPVHVDGGDRAGKRKTTITVDSISVAVKGSSKLWLTAIAQVTCRALHAWQTSPRSGPHEPAVRQT